MARAKKADPMNRDARERFGNSLDEVAREMGVTPQRINAITRKALYKLQQKIADGELVFDEHILPRDRLSAIVRHCREQLRKPMSHRLPWSEA